jgi:hypothetical protein
MEDTMSSARRSLAGLTLALGTLTTACGGASRAPETPTAGAEPYEGSSAAKEAPGSAAPAPQATQSEGADSSPSAPRAEAAPQPSERPGLATQWGETRLSRITTVPFVRADADSPFVTASLFYNDAQGARAMSSVAGFRRFTGGVVPVAGGLVQVGLRDEGGNFLSGVNASGKSYIVGEPGQRYTIVVRNRTNNRFECVISVDGLDVLDGRSASFGKRGYLVEPRGELEVDGFRQSTDTVAAFRFGSVRDSYAAQKHGDTRNVGIIGFAIFNERGTNPLPWTDDEVQRRHDANPFPGQFASPPGQ